MRTFEEIAGLLRGSAEAFCMALLPGGRKINHEWVCGSLSGEPGKSLSVNLRECMWKDFSTGEGGADLINLIAAVRGIGQGQAKREAEEWLGLPPIASGEWAAEKRRRPDVTIDPQAGFEPEPAEPDDDTNPLWYRRTDAICTHIWDYLSIDGELVAQVFRFKHPITGAKAVRPWNPKAKLWEAPKLEKEKRPLLYLQEIASTKASQPVVIVEGEKAADAIREAGYLATSCMGGAQAVGMSDWSPLAGRHVLYWRDKDKGGRDSREKMLELLREAKVASCREVAIPLDKPLKWDAANASVEERRALLAEAQKSRAIITGRAHLSLSDWTLDVYAGKAPEMEWLVEGRIPLGAPCLLAGQGDIGKGIATLDLALKVAGRPSMGDPPMAFGGLIRAHGRVVIIAGEDDKNAIHQRLERLVDPADLEWLRDRLIIVPLPNAGGNYPLLRSTGRGLEITEEGGRLRDELAAIEELRLIILDPLSRFAQANLEREVDAGQMLLGWLGSIAAELRATVLLTHHMAKDRDSAKNKEKDEVARQRELVRGSSGIVDGVRSVYCLWPDPEEDRARGVLGELKVEFVGDGWRGRVVRGAVVKCNAQHDRTVRVYVRDDRGLLVDRTDDLQNFKERTKDSVKQAKERAAKGEAPTTNDERIVRLIAGQVKLAALAGFPYTLNDSSSTLYTKKSEAADEIKALGKAGIIKMLNLALDNKIIKFCTIGNNGNYLDLPGGPFDIGEGHKASGGRTVPAATVNDYTGAIDLKKPEPTIAGVPATPEQVAAADPYNQINRITGDRSDEVE